MSDDRQDDTDDDWRDDERGNLYDRQPPDPDDPPEYDAPQSPRQD